MATRKQRKHIRKLKYLLDEENIIGNKTQFEYLCKTASALYDFINGVKQASNINNASLSQKAKDGMNYLQALDATFQQIKDLKKLMDDDFDLIDLEPEGEPEQYPSGGGEEG